MPRIIHGFEVDDFIGRPFRIIVAGASGAGKTEVAKHLVKEIHDDFQSIYYCYPDYLTDIPTEFDAYVHYHQGILTTKELATIKDHSLIIIDDLMVEASSSVDINKLFTVIGRKRNISVILLVQNLYQQGKHFRNIRMNSTGFILFKFRAAFDVNLRLLKDLGLKDNIKRSHLEGALSRKYSYLFVDIHPNRHSDFGSIRDNIFNKTFSVFYGNMEYIAIPRAEFMKYFKIIKAENGAIEAIQNEFEVKKRKTAAKKSGSPERKRKSNRKSKEQKSREISASDSESVNSSEYTSESE
jgi:hypothetical protein